MKIETIANKFKASGFELWEVGGVVRDSLLNRPIKDVDLTTNAPPKNIKQLLSPLGNIYTVGEKFGTIGLISEDIGPLEITTYRSEVYQNNSRKPKVTFGKILNQDLLRRDFTINSLARNPLTGEIVDIVNGMEDLKAKVIRCVGNDDDRFNEDPLRMLRAIRFAVQLDFTLDVKINFPEKIKNISMERIQEELNKILLSEGPEKGIQYLDEYGLLKEILPDISNMKGIPHGVHHIKDPFWHTMLALSKSSQYNHEKDNLILRLAILLHDIGKPATKKYTRGEIHFYHHETVGSELVETILKNLRYDNETVSRVAALVKNHMQPLMYLFSGTEMKKSVISRLIRKIGKENIYLLIDVAKMDVSSSANSKIDFLDTLKENVIKIIAESNPEEIKSPISGIEIMEIFGLKPSKFIGEIKQYLVNLVIDGELAEGDVDTAIKKAGEFIK